MVVVPVPGAVEVAALGDEEPRGVVALLLPLQQVHAPHLQVLWILFPALPHILYTEHLIWNNREPEDMPPYELPRGYNVLLLYHVQALHEDPVISENNQGAGDAPRPQYGVPGFLWADRVSAAALCNPVEAEVG